MIAGLAAAQRRQADRGQVGERPARSRRSPIAASPAPVLWLANLTGETQTVKVSGFNGGAQLHVLDEGSFVAATRMPAILGKGGKALKKVGTVALRALRRRADRRGDG